MSDEGWARAVRGGWLPTYRVEHADVTEIGRDQWPLVWVEKWEENSIGERRFVERRRYRIEPEPEPPDLDPDEPGVKWRIGTLTNLNGPHRFGQSDLTSVALVKNPLPGYELHRVDTQDDTTGD